MSWEENVSESREHVFSNFKQKQKVVGIKYHYASYKRPILLNSILE